jgi:hypothetical protein
MREREDEMAKDGTKITETSKALFLDYAKDAGNWSGTPLVGGNVDSDNKLRGNLTQLKRAGLVTTMFDDGCTWLFFTDAGVEYAASLGVTVTRY